MTLQGRVGCTCDWSSAAVKLVGVREGTPELRLADRQGSVLVHLGFDPN